MTAYLRLLLIIGVTMLSAIRAEASNAPKDTSLRSCRIDTVRLWEGYKTRFGDQVSLYAFRPEKPNGVSIVVCPGGSYFWLDKNTEGLQVGKWLSGHGITAFVLFYRTAGKGEFAWHTRLLFRGKRHPDMVSDGQRALQWAGEHARDYGIDRDKIGMMGFSAGGHLVLSCACFFRTDFLRESGIACGSALRPAFVAPVYPVVTLDGPYAHGRSRRGLLGDSKQHDRKMIDSLSIEKHIPDDCPPVFVVNCADDPIVDYHNSVLLDEALSAKNIPHRYLRYASGGHGFGVSDLLGTPECRQWRNEFLLWLGEIGLPVQFPVVGPLD